MSLIRKISFALRMASGRALVGEYFSILPDDVFLVSFPKSGNTWTRFLIANLTHPEERATFANINRLTPDLAEITIRDLKTVSRPRVFKSHLAFRPAYKRVIYIVRDPRDVALSQYHFHVKRGLLEEGAPIEPFVTRFVAGETTHPTYGSWGENVASWFAARQHHPLFLPIRYEDLMSQPVRELDKVATFFGIEASPQRLEEIVRLCSANEMRQMEKAQAHLWSSTKGTRRDKPFVRTAKSGGWKQELPAKSIVAIESAWGHWMDSVGYEIQPLGLDQAETRLRATQQPVVSVPGA